MKIDQYISAGNFPDFPFFPAAELEMAKAPHDLSPGAAGSVRYFNDIPISGSRQIKGSDRTSQTDAKCLAFRAAGSFARLRRSQSLHRRPVLHPLIGRVIRCHS
jgi:hypothetical protein